jgi:hypothetical protein
MSWEYKGWKRMGDHEILLGVRALLRRGMCRVLRHRWTTEDRYREVMRCKRCGVLDWRPGRGPNEVGARYCGNRWSTQSPGCSDWDRPWWEN